MPDLPKALQVPSRRASDQSVCLGPAHIAAAVGGKQQAWDVSAAVARNHQLRPHEASRFGLRAGAQSWASHSSLMGHLRLAHSRPSANCSCGLPFAQGRNQLILDSISTPQPCSPLATADPSPGPARLSNLHPAVSPHSPSSRSSASSQSFTHTGCFLSTLPGWLLLPLSIPFRAAFPDHAGRSNLPQP